MNMFVPLFLSAVLVFSTNGERWVRKNATVHIYTGANAEFNCANTIDFKRVHLNVNTAASKSNEIFTPVIRKKNAPTTGIKEIYISSSSIERAPDNPVFSF